MSQEDELIELNSVYQATAEQNEELRQLVADMMATLADMNQTVASYTKRRDALFARAKALGIEEPHETP